MVRSEMRWLKNILVTGLLLAAAVLALATVLSDHSAEYGTVGLPEGGVLHFPKGTVTVYYSQNGSISEQQQGAGLSVRVIPVAGGDPVPMSSAGGSISAEGTQRSEVIGEHGAIAKLDVPADGDYRIAAASNLQPGSVSLDFGTNAATAIASKWKLFAALVGAAFVLALIPTPRHRRRSHDDPKSPGASGAPSEWSSSRRAPYAG